MHGTVPSVSGGCLASENCFVRDGVQEICCYLPPIAGHRGDVHGHDQQSVCLHMGQSQFPLAR